MAERSGPRSSGTDETIAAAEPSGHDSGQGETIAAAGSPGRDSGHDQTIPAAGSPGHDSSHDKTIPAVHSSGVAVRAPDSQPVARETRRGGERYRLGAEIGRGGMGRVVEAFDTELGRTVALKEVLPTHSPSITKRFQREVRITARLEHASIVPLYDAGTTADGRPFYVMRRVSGRPLDELIARAHGLPERLALLPNVLAAIDAIAHAHRRGVIHRDLKPANILVGELGETVVIDWGLAKVIGEEDSIEPHVPAAADSLQTQAGAVFGTPGFMAPEQARGDELGPGSDVYALGATLYQLIAGKPPVRGTSATEVIASTLQHAIVPLETAAPNAPAELATIITKALAPEPSQRYVDAGALGEDVRRFTTGQLVAAHRYTRRQRLVRFARRHRAALSVAALAATAVAVLAWISVHRIVSERDAATAARRDAEYQRTIAEQQADEARRRADQLQLAHARSLVETSPTQAIAALAHVASTSPQTVDEAAAIAKAAVVRGVAWGIPSLPGPTTSFEMTRDGTRLLQINRAGTLQVIDLERRKQLVTVQLATGATAMWVGEDKLILVDRSGQPPALYDPTTGGLEPLAAPPVRELARTFDGKLVAYIDTDRNAGILDIAARTAKPVWTRGSAERSIAIAPDGGWLAFGDRVDAKRDRLVVVDRFGSVLAQRPGSAVVLGVSPGGKLAASLFDEIIELRPGEPITKLPLDAKETRLVHQLAYRDEVLQLVGGRNVIGFDRGRLVRGDALADTVYRAQVAAGFVVVAANDNHVHLLRDGARLVLPLTESPEGMYRVATGRATTRVAATAKDAVLVWDAAALLPPRFDVPLGPFVDHARMVVPQGPLGDWFLWHLESTERTPLALPIDGIPIDYQALADERRLLVVAQTARGTSVVTIRGDGSSELTVDDLGGGRIAIVPGNAVVYSLGKNRIFGKVGSEPSRELVSLDGEVRSLAAVGSLGYAALSATGELVRGTFGGADFARTRLSDLDKTAFVVADRDRDVIVGSGPRLLGWRGDVHELARFAVPIDHVASTDVGLYVSLTNQDLYFVPASGNRTPVRVPVSQLSSISADGRVVAGLAASQQVEVIDMPSLARWTLPKLFTGMPRAALSPDGRMLLQRLGMQVALWRLPQPGSDLTAWLAEQTNAAEVDGAIRWPWQP
jgi:hypothetical protein